MIQAVSRFILYKLLGWRVEINVPLREKCVIAVAPHTSNRDFFIGLLYSRAEKLKANFLIKKEWFFWPLNLWMHHLGGIPVTRSKKCSLTDQLATVANQRQEFRLAITPEGTRSRVEEWKKGFYYIALKANIPIMLYALDFKNKRIVCTKEIIPNGDIDSQMLEIKKYYQNFEGRHPEKFATGIL